MSEHLRDPELDRLVHELNRRAELERPGDGDVDADSGGDLGDLSDFREGGGFGADAAAGAGPAAGFSPAIPPPATVPPPRANLPYAPRAPRAPGAPGAPGDQPPGEERAEAGAWLDQLPAPPPRASLEAGDALGRLLAEALRRGASDLLLLAGLNLPPSFSELVKPSRGLVLICGPTGSGKSSTLAALIGEINRSRTAHVITIEDPVEYEHRSNRSLIEHVEIGRDARSFSEALRAALRQDPDVILVGEMRDLETMATAISAAETGHLVLATLHSNDAVQSVHRIVDVFPPSQQAQIRQQLALSLHAIVAQQLVPRADGRGRIPAIELMLASFPVRHHIRSDKLEKLYNEITLGKRQGMTSFEESLAQLVREGRIDLDEARVRASHPEELDTRLRG